MARVNDDIVKFFREGRLRNLPMDYLQGVLIDRGFPKGEVEVSSKAALDDKYVSGGNKSNLPLKKILFSLLGVCVILFLFIFVSSGSTLTLNEDELSLGLTISMSKSKLNINAFGSKNSLILSQVTDSSIKFDFLDRSKVLYADEYEDFDLNYDGKEDLRIFLEGVYSGKPRLRFTLI